MTSHQTIALIAGCASLVFFLLGLWITWKERTSNRDMNCPPDNNCCPPGSSDKCENPAGYRDEL